MREHTPYPFHYAQEVQHLMSEAAEAAAESHLRSMLSDALPVARSQLQLFLHSSEAVVAAMPALVAAFNDTLAVRRFHALSFSRFQGPCCGRP